MRLLVTREDVRPRLVHETFTLLGNQYSYREYDVLGLKYFQDIIELGLTSNIESTLHALGCYILFDNYRETVASQTITISMWRVYFRSTPCPEPLVVGVEVCEHFLIEELCNLTRGKSASLPISD